MQSRSLNRVRRREVLTECGYKIRSFQRARDFLDRAEAMLYEEEDRNATMIATANMIASGSDVFRGPFWYAIVAGGESKCLACMMHSKPDGLLMTEMPEGAGDVLYEAVNQWIGPPGRVVGSKDQAESLARRWENDFNVRIKRKDDWEILRMDSLTEPKKKNTGTLRVGREEEKEEIARWGQLYSKERPAFISIEEFFLKKLGRKELFVLDDDGARSVATVSARTKHGIRISAVFTPPEFRGRGYADSIVRQLCMHLMDSGFEFITLTTREGETVKRLYQGLGFRVVGQKRGVTFCDTNQNSH